MRAKWDEKRIAEANYQQQARERLRAERIPSRPGRVRVSKALQTLLSEHAKARQEGR